RAHGPPHTRTQDRGPFRGDLRPGLSHERAARGTRPKAREGDGRPPDRLRFPRLRSERVHRLPLVRGPRAVCGVRGQPQGRAPGVPLGACPSRGLRAPLTGACPDGNRRRSRRRRVRNRHADGATRSPSRRNRRAARRSAAWRDDGLQAGDARADTGGERRGARVGAGARDADVRRVAVRGETAARRHWPRARLRHPAGRRERLEAPCGAASGRRVVLGRRPWLHERDGSQRQAGQARKARRRRHDHPGFDGLDLWSRGALMIFDSAAVDEVLLILKIAFLVLLYVFIWRIVRTASRDLRLPQESFILAPSAAPGLQASRPALHSGRLVVVTSPDLSEGDDFELNSAQLTIGRGNQNDIAITTDEYASARHARFEPRQDGVWVQDLGSTNGTYLNGTRLDRPRRLSRGDIIRV